MRRLACGPLLERQRFAFAQANRSHARAGKRLGDRTARRRRRGQPRRAPSRPAAGASASRSRAPSRSRRSPVRPDPGSAPDGSRTARRDSRRRAAPAAAVPPARGADGCRAARPAPDIAARRARCNRDATNCRTGRPRASYGWRALAPDEIVGRPHAVRRVRRPEVDKNVDPVAALAQAPPPAQRSVRRCPVRAGGNGLNQARRMSK